jgi:hypothetical protein
MDPLELNEIPSPFLESMGLINKEGGINHNPTQEKTRK